MMGDHYSLLISFCLRQVKVQALTCPDHSKGFTFHLRVPSLFRGQGSADVEDNVFLGWLLRVVLCQNAGESNWAGVSGYLDVPVLLEVG